MNIPGDIIQDPIPKGLRNRPGLALKPTSITIHDTGNPNRGADARAHAKYLKAGAAKIPASWHFTVDDKVIIQHLPLNEVAWHAGDGYNGPGNRTSIAVEICENADGNRAKAEENAARLAVWLLKQLGLGINAVKQHYDWSRKNCPHVLRSRPGGWDGFRRLVAEFMQEPSEDLRKQVQELQAENKRLKEIIARVREIVA